MTRDNILLVTVGGGRDLYEEGRQAIDRLERGEPVEQPAKVTFADEKQLSDVFDNEAYTLLRTIREREPSSIEETARLAEYDEATAREKLTTLEALGVVRFETDEQSKRPVFPYDDLLISPFTGDSGDTTPVVP